MFPVSKNSDNDPEKLVDEFQIDVLRVAGRTTGRAAPGGLGLEAGRVCMGRRRAGGAVLIRKAIR